MVGPFGHGLRHLSPNADPAAFGADHAARGHTEVIGNALVAKVRGPAVLTIAALLNRPSDDGCAAPTRATLGGCTGRASSGAVTIDRELLVNSASQATILGHALNLLAGAAQGCGVRVPRSSRIWIMLVLAPGARMFGATCTLPGPQPPWKDIHPCLRTLLCSMRWPR